MLNANPLGILLFFPKGRCMSGLFGFERSSNLKGESLMPSQQRVSNTQYKQYNTKDYVKNVRNTNSQSVQPFKSNYPSDTQAKSPSVTTLEKALPYILKFDANRLDKLEISESGEYHKLGSPKKAHDVIAHIKETLKEKGYGIYALHNAIWIVPFIHPDVIVPDFQKAADVLPNYREELQKVLNEDACSKKSKRIRNKQNKKSKTAKAEHQDGLLNRFFSWISGGKW